MPRDRLRRSRELARQRRVQRAVARIEIRVNAGIRARRDLVSDSDNLRARPGQPLSAVERVNESESLVSLTSGFDLEAGTWYVLRLYLGDGTPNNPFRLYVWKRDDPATLGKIDVDVAEIGLETLARKAPQRDERLLVPTSVLAKIALHLGIGAGVTVLVADPPEHLRGGVPLLGRGGLVVA